MEGKPTPLLPLPPLPHIVLCANHHFRLQKRSQHWSLTMGEHPRPSRTPSRPTPPPTRFHSAAMSTHRLGSKSRTRPRVLGRAQGSIPHTRN
jgi:hypothetical protein